jgi:hypothetical protein
LPFVAVGLGVARLVPHRVWDATSADGSLSCTEPSRIGERTMAVARSDEGPGNLTRKRLPRKVGDVGLAPPPVHQPAPSLGQRVSSNLRLDDLYRLPMPRLFALAEREGVAEHTGMNRGQLIVAVVRRQVERGEVVRGAGPQLPCLAGRHLRLAQPDPPARPAHRPGGRRADPSTH